MTNDLTAARNALLQGRTTVAEALAANVESADSTANAQTYLKRFDAQAQATAANVDRLHAAGAPLPPLDDLAVSVKALFDVQGHRTTAASRVLAAAQTDSPAVARLRTAGAALTGHTNMTEFAFSGVGLNPHHGTPPSPVTLAVYREPRIRGGSTSGGAISVASGAAWAALGSDTGGSIRIPAGLQGLVGFKNTARLTPTEGTIPPSTTLDTACAITHTVRDAVLLHEVLAGRQVTLVGRPVRALRLAVPESQLAGMDDIVARVFERTVDTLRNTGAQIDILSLTELGELAPINATGGFSAAESWAWHRQMLNQSMPSRLRPARCAAHPSRRNNVGR